MEFPKRMLLNNDAWAKGKVELRPDFFSHMVEGQHPQALWIGCSDSRVPAESLSGAQPGELFVHRNVANIFTSNDDSAMSVLQYAVEALKVPYIILCGHKGCGGAAAAATGQGTGTLSRWLEPVASLKPQLTPSMTEQEKVEAYVQANIVAGADRIRKTDIVQKAWANRQGPIVLGWEYNTFSGAIAELVSFSPHDVETELKVVS